MSSEEKNDASKGSTLGSRETLDADLNGKPRVDREALRAPFLSRFETYRHNIVAARLLGKIGYMYLGDLPKSLPESEFNAYKETLLRSLDVGLQWSQTDDKEWVGVSPLPTLDEDGSAADIFELAVAYKEERANKQFVRHVALEQCVVNAFAQLDALLQDAVETIAMMEPRTLSSAKQISHADVVQQGNWESLLRHISQKFLAEFGRENLKRRLEILAERFGLRLDMEIGLLNNILIGEQTRHLFTHTGGIVSIDFLQQTKLKEYEVGNKIEISVKYCNQLTEALLYLGVLLWKEIESKYFAPPQTLKVDKPDEHGLHAFANNANTAYKIVQVDSDGADVE